MASSSSSSSSVFGSWKYDVFLSFRGEDTRKTIVDHLYSALQRHATVTYKDDVTLDRDDTIGPSLVNAIQSSQILVIIFSENYAESSWCLDELSHIMKCKDSDTGQIVFPIFYHVDPSDVRKQKGTYGEAFAKHELSEINKKKVGSWKKALVDASNIAGWETKHVGNGHEAKAIQEIVDSILGKLSALNTAVEDENLDGLFLDSSSIKLIRSSMARFLRKLYLGDGGLKDGDIPDEIGELSNLRELYLYENEFTRLNFSLSRLTHLKLLNLSWCKNLVELPELPSSLAILKAIHCESLEVIKDDAHTRCKWLCGVSIWGKRGNIIGGERLLESMLQGEVVKSGSMLLRLNGSEIPRGFEPRLVRGERCRMQLPENWYNHFFGFLFCVVSDKYDTMITTRMKHDKSVVDDRMEKNDDDRSVVVDWLEGSKSTCTWVGYISFGSLRNTLWWDQTSTAIEFEFYPLHSTIIGCGCKIIPKRSETTIITDSSSFDDVSNDYNCKLDILHDSESTFKFLLCR